MKGLDDEYNAKEAPAKPAAPTSYTLPTGYLSNSQMGMYQRCPKQYEFRYIKGMANAPGVAMAMGSAVHKAIEDIHQTRIDTGDYLDADSAVDSFSDAWDESLLKYEIDLTKQVVDPRKAPDTKDLGVRLVRQYREVKAPTIEPEEVEKRVEGVVAGVPILGYIDLIDRGRTPGGKKGCVCSAEERKTCKEALLCNLQKAERVVVDNKVTGRAKSQSDANNSLQLSGYALLEDATKVRYDCLVKTKGGGRMVSIESTRTDQDLLWYKEIVKGVADGISRGYFPPCPPDSWCCSAKWCGYWSQCRGKKR